MDKSEFFEWYDIEMNQAQWSDKFFNYVPAEQAYDVKKTSRRINADLKEAADMFRDANPDCPHSSEWLAREFRRRI